MFAPSEDNDEALRTEERRLTDQIIWDSFPKQPPDDDLALLRGIAAAFLLATPFWLAIGIAIWRHYGHR